MGLLAAQWAVIGALDVLFVVLAVESLDLGDAGAGYLNAAFGAGGVLAIGVTAALVARRRLVAPLLIGVGVWSVALVATGAGVAPSVAGTVLLLALAGVGRSLFDVAGRTLLQRSVCAEALARVFGVLEALAMTGLAVGALAAPALVAAGGPSGALLAAGVLLPLLALGASRRLTTVDRGADVPIVEIALMRSMPLMALLAPSEIERLARGLDTRALRRGDVVITQGQSADAFYLVAGGELDVICDDARVGSLARGDGFGEIGLLDGIPRTASVVACGEALVLAMHGDAFLEVVGASPDCSREARTLASARRDPSA